MCILVFRTGLLLKKSTAYREIFLEGNSRGHYRSPAKGKGEPEVLKQICKSLVRNDYPIKGRISPSMGGVLWNLEFALRLHENPNGASLTADERSSRTTGAINSGTNGSNGGKSSIDEQQHFLLK
ncbi:hypothetical protein IFM89_037324 [Coptis chinensis]|uniref:Uncharacterized protein n=1 Tax=Coptis chinensis TaxID=261450 RepID=A0A835HMN7_9MAGN|nr:hypothetical protein IFM89_037324 [Coptis chinensis]